MKKQFNDIVFVFPVMIYYLFESAIVSVFILLMWRLFLTNFIGTIGYFQIFAVYWIFKMLFFDVFKLITGLNSANINIRREMEEEPVDNEE